MKGFLITVLLLIAVVVGVGFYLGWFRVSTTKTDSSTDVTFSIDRDKMKADTQRAEHKADSLGQKVKGSLDAATEKWSTTTTAPATAPE